MHRLAAFLIAVLFAPVSGLAAEAPATPEAWLTRMLDARQNGSALKDPALFAEWLDAVTEPRFMTALAAATSNPATYPEMLSHALDPAAVRNWAEFTDPRLYLRWMLTSANPAFQRAIISKLADPAKFRRWQEALADGAKPMPAGQGVGLARPDGQDDPRWLTLSADRLPVKLGEPAVRQRY